VIVGASIPPETEVFLQQMSAGDTRMVKRLVETFLSDSKSQLAVFVASAQQGDMIQAKNALHTLKGISMTLHFTPLITMSQTLELADNPLEAACYTPLVAKAESALQGLTAWNALQHS
jgi:HPt (histidine-containing phosphotransfer) domain-containing protein